MQKIVAIVFLVYLLMECFGARNLGQYELSLDTDNSIKSSSNYIKSPNLTGTLSNIIKEYNDNDESSGEMEKSDKRFDRIIHLVNLLGQVDTYLSEKTKNVIKKLATLAEDDDDSF